MPWVVDPKSFCLRVSRGRESVLIVELSNIDHAPEIVSLLASASFLMILLILPLISFSPLSCGRLKDLLGTELISWDGSFIRTQS